MPAPPRASGAHQADNDGETRQAKEGWIEHEEIDANVAFPGTQDAPLHEAFIRRVHHPSDCRSPRDPVTAPPPAATNCTR